MATTPHYPNARYTWHRGRTDTAAARPAAPIGALAMPRRRGLGAGIVLLILGIWGGISRFVGPSFDYRADAAGTWAMTWDRWWLSALPAIAVVVGAAILVAAGDRVSGAVGASLALAGGIWFVIGPSVALLWGRSPAPVGTSGSATLRFLEELGMFYGLGALIIAVAAATWARVLVRSRRDAAILAASAAAVEPAPRADGDVVPGSGDYRYGVAGDPVVGDNPEVERPADVGPYPGDGSHARHAEGPTGAPEGRSMP